MIELDVLEVLDVLEPDADIFAGVVSLVVGVDVFIFVLLVDDVLVLELDVI